MSPLNKALLLFFISVYTSLPANSQETKFACPIRKGKIVEYFHSNEVAEKPGATFKGSSSVVHNVLEGIVVAVDTTSSFLRVHIKSGEFFFSYYGFGNVEVSKGQKVLSTQKLGSLKQSERLFLIMSYKNELVEPKEYLKCKTVTQYL
jgi:hypothetical protein